jgi:imidazolonepropionase-like amidohydrolase
MCIDGRETATSSLDHHRSNGGDKRHPFILHPSALILSLACWLLLELPLAAQVPAPPQNHPVALTGGTIHTMAGDAIDGGTILFQKGVITAIGEDVPFPEDVVRVDTTGKHIYPGLIHAFSNLGLYEISTVDVATDTNELGDFNPNVRAEVAFHPDSRHIGVARSAGVLVAVAAPGGGRISGYASAMMLDGWTWEQMSLSGRVGLVINWPPTGNEPSYHRSIKRLREVFAEARAWQRARQAADRGEASPPQSDPRSRALQPVLDRDLPVIVNADELRQLQDAIRWAEQEQVRLVLRGGRDAAYVLDHLVEKQIPLLLTSVLDSPSRPWRPVDDVYSLPGRLSQAGVTFAITGEPGAAYLNRLPHEAAAAVAYGLPEKEALKAVTINTARILGIDARVGSLEVGKDATLMITTGSPLEFSTEIEQAYVQGRKIDMQNAHRQFFDKYMERVRQSRTPVPDLEGVPASPDSVGPR